MSHFVPKYFREIDAKDFLSILERPDLFIILVI